jgi:hypothetical protein
VKNRSRMISVQRFKKGADEYASERGFRMSKKFRNIKCRLEFMRRIEILWADDFEDQELSES